MSLIPFLVPPPNRGARYLLVEALPTSQPILQGLGFRRIADTWACEWDPPRS